jgi:tetratricopeptide (TPR) repeat protein
VKGYQGIPALALILGLSVSGAAFGLDPILARADGLDTQGKFGEARDLLLEALPGMATASDKASVYWRLSREFLGMGDNEHGAGQSNDAVIATYQDGERYAEKAIQADPANAQGYFWKSGNLGKIGLIRGPLNSLSMVPELKALLSKTIELDPAEEKAFYALGQLYAKVPGWPLSFGNIDQGVSLARKSVDMLNARIAAGTAENVDFGFYLELARDLHQRNWDAARRIREHSSKRSKYESTSNVVEKNLYYEGIASIPNMSDRDEAVQLARKVVQLIGQKQSPLTDRDRRELSEAKQLVSAWQ